MKLSFSISSQSSSKSKPRPNKPQEPHNHDNKQFVSVFDSQATPTDSNRPFVIPPKENEWRPIKRMKNLDLPLQSDSAADNIGFEVESLSATVDAADNISYGLNVRETDGDKGAAGKPAKSTEDILLDKLKYDLERLPEDAGFADYDDVPVEGFGAALLAGYGWTEGRGIGRNAKEDVKVKQYEKRTDKVGLGFVSHEIKSNKGRDFKEQTGRTRDRNGEEKEKSRNRDQFGDGYVVGKEVRVIHGKSHTVGLKGRIVERLDRNWLFLKLTRTEEKLEVRVSDIADLGSKEEEYCLRKLKELKIEQAREPNGNYTGKPSGERKESVKRDSRGSELKDDLQRGVGWLRRHIRVRIISKGLKGGRLYLKKGEVVDVVGPYKCDISMDESRELVQDVDQSFLETALPRRGGPVLVLYGKHEGVYGSLVQRDLDREVGVVQDSDTHELINVKLEQISEYIGDPSYIGY